MDPRGPYLDKDGTDLVNGGGTIVYASNDDVYAPGGEGVLNDGQNDILFYHYGTHNPYIIQTPRGNKTQQKANSFHSQHDSRLRLQPDQHGLELPRLSRRMASRDIQPSFNVLLFLLLVNEVRNSTPSSIIVSFHALLYRSDLIHNLIRTYTVPSSLYILASMSPFPYRPFIVTRCIGAQLHTTSGII